MYILYIIVLVTVFMVGWNIGYDLGFLRGKIIGRYTRPQKTKKELDPIRINKIFIN